MNRTLISFGFLLLALACLPWPKSQGRLAADEPVPGNASDNVPESLLREKIRPALQLIEHSSAVYLRERECFSCHHQAMSIMTLMLARDRSFAIDHQNLVNQVQRSIEHLARGSETYRQGKGQGGGVDTAGYALMGLAAAGYPANSTTDAVVEYLLQIHADSRRWKCSSNRPPTEASDLTTSALALHGLNHFAANYARAAKDADGKESTDDPAKSSVEVRLSSRRNDCGKWLATKNTQDTEDRVFRLFAAQELNQPDVVQAMQQALIQSQRDDGGWSQTGDMSSDAYATGSALVALAKSGLSTSDVCYQRGLRYLLEHQQSDGSWHVATRSKPIQKYFESGFPHGVDQFISISASCWSSMAMLLALPKSSSSENSMIELPWEKKEAQPTQVASAELTTRPKKFTAEQLEFFEQNIRPLLVENCVSCHGNEKQSGSLRLDDLASMLSGGDTGPALVPGAPDRSLMIKAIKRGDELKMPPDDPLSQRKIELLEQWIAMGAPWPESSKTSSIDRRRHAARSHWAFQPVGDVTVPASGFQTPHNMWAQNPVDRFVHAALSAAQLEPNAMADRSALLRRLFYDMTGLPPTAEQTQAFVDDDRPDAYERQVERLMASPRFGEHWGRKWLDIARYSDSKGYVYAREERFYVNAPAYRDWVIEALASDMPYDRFVMLQLAADQVAPDDKAAQAAMGYLTLGRRFLGVTHDIIDDRIDVVTRGLLGLTVGCARCHDHKFDPIPTDDYYSLYGVFLNVTEERVEVASDVDSAAATRSDEAQKFYEELAKRQTKLRESLAAERGVAGKRVRERLADYMMAQLEMEKVPAEGFDIIIGRDDLVPAQVRRVHDYLRDAQSRNDRLFKAWHLFAALPREQFAHLTPAVMVELSKLSTSELNPHVARLFLSPPASLREVAERYAGLLNDLDNIECTSDEEMDALRELHDVLKNDNSPFIVPDEQIVSTEQFFESRVCEALWKLQGEVDRWILQSPVAPPFATVLVDRSEIREPYVFRRGNPLLASHRVPRHFLSAVAIDAAASTVGLHSGLTSNRAASPAPENADTRAIAPTPFQNGSGRLELAQAIVDHHNPLTARVWVNRLWQHLFGQGLVTTPSDFGLRATAPSHPELLDYMARRLWESDGSTKQLLREMVLSSTYRQSSSPMQSMSLVSRAKDMDPDNRLLWHAPMKRLTFEQQRDTWLMVAGALDNTRGGRARSMFDNSDNARRSVYGQVDRQFLPGVLRVFDFANPDLHTPVRSETIVPQQALFELNHPFAASSARRVVESIWRATAGESPKTSDSLPASDDRVLNRVRVERMFQQVLARLPQSRELESALAFLDQPPGILPQRRKEADAWQYGYGKLDESKGIIEGFKTLPHYSGTAWQGGSKWPDSKLGWVQITAKGGHAGNDLEHAAVRRWTAPSAGQYRASSKVKHDTTQGDGVRATLIMTRQVAATAAEPAQMSARILHQQVVHNSEAEFSTEVLQLEVGDLLDFVVDFHKNLNNDQFEWSPKIERISGNDVNTTKDAGEADGAKASALAVATDLPKQWNADADFAGTRVEVLSVWEQLAQVLLVSNELMFIE